MRAPNHYLDHMIEVLKEVGDAFRRGHSVLGVANEFLEWADYSDIELTPMQLQKLCYLAHGFSLALLGKPLVKDPVEAWDWGPVFPQLYDAVKRYGSGPVVGPIRENNWASYDHVRGEHVTANLSPDERGLMAKVLKTYGKFQGFQLSALTHEAGSPWEQVYVPGKRSIRIPDSLIKQYFDKVVTGGNVGQHG